MENIHHLNDAALLDLLSDYTARYTQLIAEKNMDSPEFQECKAMVKYLQKEIEKRQKNQAKDSSKN